MEIVYKRWWIIAGMIFLVFVVGAVAETIISMTDVSSNRLSESDTLSQTNYDRVNLDSFDFDVKSNGIDYEITRDGAIVWAGFDYQYYQDVGDIGKRYEINYTVYELVYHPELENETFNGIVNETVQKTRHETIPSNYSSYRLQRKSIWIPYSNSDARGFLTCMRNGTLTQRQCFNNELQPIFEEDVDNILWIEEQTMRSYKTGAAPLVNETVNTDFSDSVANRSAAAGLAP